jgi:hypothetical protein
VERSLILRLLALTYLNADVIMQRRLMDRLITTSGPARHFKASIKESYVESWD